ncbi:MAG: 4-hydroxy-tetrahydrodipicolinate reductase [Pirellulales bacterium]|nr:4-hydroxy-tetrahydrodipicolinate reductase [Pirellulales bacterium]
MNPVHVAIFGAAGRMGRRLVALASTDPELELVAALDRSDCPHLGEDAGRLAGVDEMGVTLSTALEVRADALIDFSTPEGTEAAVSTALKNRAALVVATTGLGTAQKAAMESAAAEIPVLWAPNMSLAVNLAIKLAEVAAGALAQQDADVEILERHHRFKEDSPSGTALEFGRRIAEIMGQTVHQHGRQGRPGARPHGEIGYHAIRTGDNPGEHTIVFGMLGETVEVTVRASNRDCYAVGALAAAKYLAGKPPALYSIRDVLGL